jgi:amidophosphoribosyltransferase
MKNIPGSYVLAIADRRRKEVIILRDKYSVKPASLGLKDGKFCVASEDIAFVENGVKYVEELEPGSIYYLSARGGYRKENIVKEKRKSCFFEWNYIADVQSEINGTSVQKIREELGKALALEFSPKDIDIVTYLPRCPEVAARTYAKAIGKESKFIPIFYKLRGERAFQGTTKEDRKTSIKTNLHLLPEMCEKLKGKTIAVIDDSTVRGNNAKHAKELLDKCKVKKIYYLNYTPKIGIIGADGKPRGCMFGVDMPINDDFIVRTKEQKNKLDEEINKELGMKVYFLSVEGMLKAFEKTGINRKNLCFFCIGGEHPFK